MQARLAGLTVPDWCTAARSLAVAGAVGAGCGAVIGGPLARLAMRLVLVADSGTRGFDTAAGATVGDVTAGGTAVVVVAAALAGGAIGVVYCLARPLLPARRGLRVALSTVAATALGTALVARDARADFAFVPEAVSVVLIVAAFALMALGVLVAVERVVPGHTPVGRWRAWPIVALAVAGLVAFAWVQVLASLAELRVV